MSWFSSLGSKRTHAIQERNTRRARSVALTIQYSRRIRITRAFGPNIFPSEVRLAMKQQRVPFRFRDGGVLESSTNPDEGIS